MARLLTQRAKDEAKAIVQVWAFDNGMVCVFDGKDRQIPRFQGKRKDVESLLVKVGWPCQRWQWQQHGGR